MKKDKEIEKMRESKGKLGGSVEVEATISWGGKEGVTFSGGGAGQLFDKQGNHLKGKVTQGNKGKGSATISGEKKWE